MSEIIVCKVDGCSRRHYGHGYCHKHYQRWKRHGSVTSGRTENGEPKKFIETVLSSPQTDSCILWPYTKNNTGTAQIRVNGITKVVSRIVCESANGPPPTDRHECAHNCGNGHNGCINPYHLRWATHSENMADMVIHGTSLQGERHPQSKLSVDDVRAIRDEYPSIGYKKLSRKYGVDPSTIRDIIKMKRWRHI